MFFVMACGYDDDPKPIETEYGSIATFKTHEEAEEAAQQQYYCKATGYKIFEM